MGHGTSISPEQEEILGITEGVLSYTLTKLKRPRKVRFALTDLTSLRSEISRDEALMKETGNEEPS